MKVVVKMRGTCGELAQGFFQGEPLLITCPIEKFSTVVVSDEFAGVEGLGEKSLAMLENVLKIFGAEKNFGVRLTSELPRGKGMASSSADIAAVAQAVALSLNKNFSPAELGKLCAAIEPTDGIFYLGVVAMNPLTGCLVKKIRAQEKFQIAVFDYGGGATGVFITCTHDFLGTDRFEILLDGGKIIAQRAFEYDGSDPEEVHRIGQKIEHALYVETIDKLLKEL